MSEIENTFSSFRERWNSRAYSWDTEILRPEHYVNFEDGYRKFLDFETAVLDAFPSVATGIDLGCGTGIAAEPLSKKVEKLFLLDIAEKMLEEAEIKFPEADILHESATNISLDDDSVDVAISRGVLISHLPQGEYINYLSEVHRILKPGGLFIFDFLNNLQTADYHLSSEKTVFTRESITEELKRQGFGNSIFDGQDINRVLRVAVVA
jgi:predicted TPR repeat methyltransferase